MLDYPPHSADDAIAERMRRERLAKMKPAKGLEHPSRGGCMKIFFRIEAMGIQVAEGEKEISNYCASFSSVMDDLRKEYGNWASIFIHFPPVPKN